MQRLGSWSIVVLALAVFAAAAFVITKQDPVPDAGKILSLPSSTVGSPAGTTSRTAPSSASSSSSPGGVLAFLGDDWTAGIGASSGAKRFSTLVANDLGLQEKNFGVDGTGYAKSSEQGGTYGSRVDDVVAARPDVVVVSGGRNDTVDDLATARTSIRQLFANLHEQLPDATLIAVEPMWGDSDKPTELAPLATAIKKAVTSAGGHYVGLEDPIHGHADYMSDDADPNNAGYAAIAAALTPRLSALLPNG